MNSVDPEEVDQEETECNDVSHETSKENLQNVSDDVIPSKKETNEEVNDLSFDEVPQEEISNTESLTDISIDEILLERDEYLSLLQSIKAEFDNYKKRIDKRIDETRTNARGDLVEKLLPVLDACDAAVLQGADDVVAIRKALIDSLELEGLELVGKALEKFDPSIHEAISHEPGNEEDEDQLVIEVLRQGYFWEGKILRPAMVKVRG